MIAPSACPRCGARMAAAAVIHHMACAYVGPDYDFADARCPKCRRVLRTDEAEIVGNSARCTECGAEVMAPPG